MREIKLGQSNLRVPVIGIGCMRLNSLTEQEAEHYLHTALENGVNFFDHADIYGGGVCEEFFAKTIGMNSCLREKIILQSKCGIVPGRVFDLSKEHILSAVDGSLERLNTDYLDVLLLHRPDALAEMEEIAEAFDILYSSGKVRYFGVSNYNPMQIQLLKKWVKQPIIVNQLQFSIMHAAMVSSGINVNMNTSEAIDRDGSVLDFCRLNDITIQAWSPFQYGFFEGTFLDNEKFPELNNKIRLIASKYGVSNTTIALAWILRHPARMQPIIGTMNISRLLDCIKAADICLSRQEWYDIYVAAGHILP